MVITLALRSWDAQPPQVDREGAVTALETGHVLYLPHLAFAMRDEERIFLSARYSNPGSKNISFNPMTDELRGLGRGTRKEEYAPLAAMMARYARGARRLLDILLPRYQPFLETGRTSFRPAEIAGRIASSCRKDDTRLHVDAFPASPVLGKRILRIFSNVSPDGKKREWRIGEPFEAVARHFVGRIRPPLPGSATLLRLLRVTRDRRALYDHFMLDLHNRMKVDGAYQDDSPQTNVHFAPGSTWMVFTDQVPHAAMAGQHALEQTFYLPVSALATPEQSPLRILERLTGYRLV
ncbi:MAG: Kdo hydroxylase family protein [Candidatus Thiosymbion ectosymbiont of Robbea hypermnestra]|nr:Kdo hydroxylase family protein [Candidatus Thiosymbion ectosymbiont of Robbea hypermnestra]